jgi:uncharacterized cupin superfamily protein
VPEARLVETESGLEPEGKGWFVVNAREAAWWRHRGIFGFVCDFENVDTAPFPQLGINLRVLQPGEPNGRYHGEGDQEDFLVLAGECLLLVEGNELRLAAWDFVHCPPWTEHVFVGAGHGPCVILMVGARLRRGEIVHPVSKLARSHGAGVREESGDPQYADLRERLPDLGLPWQ